MIPSREIAKRAKMAWDGLSEEEAIIEANKGTGKDAIDSVWAGKSVEDAIDGISRELNLTEEERAELVKATYDGPENMDLFNQIVSKTQSHPEKESMILSILSSIHDGWVKDNAGRFDEKLSKGQARQYAPLEVIGWNEATSDLLFLEPILNALGVEINMELLQDEFYKELDVLLKNEGITSLDDLEVFIAGGAGNYLALEGELSKKVEENYKAIVSQIIENWETKDKKSITIFEQRKLESIQEQQHLREEFQAKKESLNNTVDYNARQSMTSTKKTTQSTDYKIVILLDKETGKQILTTEGTIGLDNEEWAEFLVEHPEYKDAERYPYNYFLDANGNLDESRYQVIAQFDNKNLNGYTRDYNGGFIKPVVDSESNARKR